MLHLRYAGARPFIPIIIMPTAHSALHTVQTNSSLCSNVYTLAIVS